MGEVVEVDCSTGFEKPGDTTVEKQPDGSLKEVEHIPAYPPCKRKRMLNAAKMVAAILLVLFLWYKFNQMSSTSDEEDESGGSGGLLS